MHDKWFITWGKATLETKTRVNKTVDIEKKLIEKLNKAWEQVKGKGKDQPLVIRKLVLSNNCETIEVGTFKNIISDIVTEDNLLPDNNTIPVQSLTTESLRTTNLSLLEKKKVKGKSTVDQLNASRKKSREQ